MTPGAGSDRPKDEMLRRCAEGRPWLYEAYWMFGGEVEARRPDPAEAPTLALLSELLRDGDVVAGVPVGWFGFEPWSLSAEESIERIGRGWAALKHPPNVGDVAAFAMPQERRARYRREHPVGAAELESIRRQADGCLEGLSAELEDLPEVAEEWEEMDGSAREMFAYEWEAITIANDLIALESWHRDGLLSAVQEGRYRFLKEELRGALPVLERLDLQPPGEVLDG